MPDQASQPPVITAAMVGARLHEARTSRGLQLAEIAATLRIKPAFLNALEGGQPELLPTATHASGFLRSYARYLGVELSEIQSTPLLTPAPTLTPPAAVATSRWAVAIPPVLVLGGILLLYALWHWLQPVPVPPIAPPPADFGKLEPVAPIQTVAPVAALAMSPANPLDATVPMPTPPDAKTETVPVSAPNASETNATPVLNATPPISATVKPSSSMVQPTATPPSVGARPLATTAPLPRDSTVVQAVSDSWVQITDVSGKQLFSRLLRAGESWRAPPQPGLKLSTGNAGGLKIIHNGKSSGTLGARAQVIRSLPLDSGIASAPRVTPQAAAPAASNDDYPFTDEEQ